MAERKTTTVNEALFASGTAKEAVNVNELLANGKECLLGSGTVYMQRLGRAGEELYSMGNCSNLALTMSSESQEIMSSQMRVKTTLAKVQTSAKYDGSLSCETITARAVGYFICGGVEENVVAADKAGTATVALKKDPRAVYEIPSGMDGKGYFAQITSIKSGETELQRNLDYYLANLGGLFVLTENGIAKASGGSLTVAYESTERTIQKVASSGNALSVRLVYVSNNANGADFVLVAPNVSVSPADDFQMIGTDFASLHYSLSFNQGSGGEPNITIYRDAEPDGRVLESF